MSKKPGDNPAHTEPAKPDGKRPGPKFPHRRYWWDYGYAQGVRIRELADAGITAVKGFKVAPCFPPALTAPEPPRQSDGSLDSQASLNAQPWFHAGLEAGRTGIAVANARRRWTKATLDQAVLIYQQQEWEEFRVLEKAIETEADPDRRAKVVTRGRRTFGARAIGRALGADHTSVRATDAWQKIAKQLRLEGPTIPQGTRHTRKLRRIALVADADRETVMAHLEDRQHRNDHEAQVEWSGHEIQDPHESSVGSRE